MRRRPREVEVSRRLLAAADAQAAALAVPPIGSAGWRRRAVAIVALVMLPLGASALYLALGSPSTAGSTARDALAATKQNQSIENLIAQVEAHLERNPDDGRGWEVIAPVYLRLGRFEDAVKARRNALRLNGETAERQAALGEALVYAANGIVTAEAKAAFERALALDPNDVEGALLPRAGGRAGRPARASGGDLARHARGCGAPTRRGPSPCAGRSPASKAAPARAMIVAAARS